MKKSYSKVVGKDGKVKLLEVGIHTLQLPGVYAMLFYGLISFKGHEALSNSHQG